MERTVTLLDSCLRNQSTLKSQLRSATTATNLSIRKGGEYLNKELATRQVSLNEACINEDENSPTPSIRDEDWSHTFDFNISIVAFFD